MTTTTQTINWKMTPKSSFIEKVAWTHKSTVNGKPVGTMHIVMTSGTYSYESVPLHIYAAFHRSGSKGKAYNKHIKGRYSSEKVLRVATPVQALPVQIVMPVQIAPPVPKLTKRQKAARKQARIWGFTKNRRYAA